MSRNLLRSNWGQLDSHELRILLDERIGGPGQYKNQAANPNRLYLPLAGAECRVVLTYSNRTIASIEPGEAFDAVQWENIAQEIETSILTGPTKIGREYSFSSYRVEGSWRGERSGLQILPPHPEAPKTSIESAEHPFILEFPLQEADLWPITNHRRQKEHRRLTLLLNTLLAGRTNLQPPRGAHFWAAIHRGGNEPEIQWVQNWYFAKLGQCVRNSPSLLTENRLAEIEAEHYFTEVWGLDGLGLRVPSDLDDSICLYRKLPSTRREEFDRAAFWLDIASRQWHVSVSASFAALISTIEALINTRGRGTTQRFRDFVEQYAPGTTVRAQRDKMYDVRSEILHGSGLLTMDEDIGFGWDPPEWIEQELHKKLWNVTRIALRNWLRNPPSR